jgi:hypothetical protein
MASEPNAEMEPAGEPPVTSLARSRAETVQRLQVGLSGLAAMILLVSLANIILDQANEAEQGAVGDDPAALAQDAEPAPATAKDPLADAGVVPDIPASPTPAVTPAAAASGANASTAQP